ncbi:hypothetical protein QCA50_004542 [Cerrena zonata]|uniref:BTB domain-containing protein n=1 Tax=Cerrena zonata TaxID=2478898 RepID=A0AAW0GJR5_9APHY
MEDAEWLQFLADIETPPEEGRHDLEPGPQAISEKAWLSAISETVPFLLTPPDSNVNTPVEEREENTIVSVSTAFLPDTVHTFVSGSPDLIIVSSDHVHFYVHKHQVLGASENGFNFLLGPISIRQVPCTGTIITLPETSTVINVILHIIYNVSCTHYSPSAGTMVQAVDTFPKYGIPISKYAAPSTPLFSHILSLAPYSSIEMYTLAASHDLEELAIPISSHLLGYPLPEISDDIAAKMGSIYLKRLITLHLNRLESLKELLLSPPPPHVLSPTSRCSSTEQQRVTRAWALAAANLAWDARPDLSTSAMISKLSALGESLTCTLCRDTLHERIKELCIQWSAVKTTI